MSGLDARVVTTLSPRPGPRPGHHPAHDPGSFRLDVALRVAPGQVLAVLGPNGAGKSTVLRVLCGLQPLTSGHVRLDDRVLEQPGRSRRVQAQQRGVGLVPQESMLFPHLSVLDQVAFGGRHQGLGRTQARAHAADWLGRTGLSGLAERRPAQLSGGQARRVAITRALAVEPRMLLLDEPLAALDVRAVLELRSFLHRHLRSFGGVSVLVTHDALDAMVLADRLVVLDRGQVVQEGSPAEVARQPRSEHVAALVGLNLLRGVADGHAVRLSLPAGGDRRTSAAGVLTTSEPHRGEVFASFSPAAVALHPVPPRGSARNVWQGAVTGLTPHGDVVRVGVRTTSGLDVTADVTPHAVADLGLAPGTTVWASVKATEVQVYAWDR